MRGVPRQPTPSALAPASYASLKPGASQEEINSAERALGVRVPADLKALWALHDGVRTVHGEAFLMDNARLMGIAQVVELHGYWGKNYDFRDSPDEPSDLWDHRWIPVCSLGEHRWATGLYLDSGTGELWSWDEHANRQVKYELRFRSWKRPPPIPWASCWAVRGRRSWICTTPSPRRAGCAG
ncbi:SMI1/KNR4 family protein [Streptomyces sp. NBC_00648]